MVPDVIFSTIEPVEGFEVNGKGCFIHVRVCGLRTIIKSLFVIQLLCCLLQVLRLKKDVKGEQNAKEISYALPFVEYEINRQLTNKLRVKGMNALFGLKVKISMGKGSKAFWLDCEHFITVALLPNR